jgi:hypothetical protein
VNAADELSEIADEGEHDELSEIVDEKTPPTPSIVRGMGKVQSGGAA